MTENKLQAIYNELCLTSVFIEVLKKPLIQAFAGYCELSATEKTAKRKAYATFVSEIYRHGESLTALTQKYLFEDENVYIKALAAKEQVPSVVEASALRELAAFSRFGALTTANFAFDLGVSAEEIPGFSSVNADMGTLYLERARNIDKYGYGIFSANRMFRLSDSKEIEPIVSADKTEMSQFVGYEAERNKVVENTRAFIEGRPAANVLLCGDAGAGKSSTVKAVANFFFEKGVRLIELRKDQLCFLPYVMGKISGNPLKFIIFIDDLSFNQNDDNFSMLKAALEGSASAKAENAVIYATSNRRHIVKESFADRDGDDVHVNDTLQETLSLSERFGLVVLFSKPDKKLYLRIVCELARRLGVTMEASQLELQAEAFALKKGSRSARCAEQFIKSLL